MPYRWHTPNASNTSKGKTTDQIEENADICELYDVLTWDQSLPSQPRDMIDSDFG
jgi:hypothetical protein